MILVYNSNNHTKLNPNSTIMREIIPRQCYQSRYRDNSHPSSTASHRSREYGPHQRWRAAEEAERIGPPT